MAAHSWRATDRFVPRTVLQPLQRLMAVETSSAVVILLATLAALIAANSPLAHAYAEFWETPLKLDLGGVHLVRRHRRGSAGADVAFPEMLRCADWRRPWQRQPAASSTSQDPTVRLARPGRAAGLRVVPGAH